ncbi:uncharacterized protein NEMAJ01_1645 [Nematocida major]|uniref:uncharacterized protein n=1 Tax=Nematocida major TaxID=1912982 RepID=UPI00200783EB|nr:uncharacterized protein NEMAJ01_1645 [Nematocida major]KAH9386749.1 hypothetical protein NEMAJ01_1645 [Nematocida major]
MPCFAWKALSPGPSNTRQAVILRAAASVYDAVKFSTIELIISRHEQTLKVFENEKNLEVNLHKLAAIQLRTGTYSLVDSLIMADYIVESTKRISKAHKKNVDGSVL